MMWRTPQANTARPCDGWRDHFSSVVVPSTHDDFSSEFQCSMTLRFFELTSDQHSSGVFDAPFSESGLSRVLSKCHDSAPGLDGLRYSTFQQHFPWWRAMLLDFFNLLLSWNVVPSVWKLSQVVPVFKDGDPADPDRYRPISLASCAFKVFERLIHGRIAPHICNRLDDSQGGFRCCADACVYGLVDALRLRQDTHTFCAFVDIRKAFDTSWVEATLVRLHQSGVTGGMWRTIANFLCGTLSQVRVRGDVSPPWVDTGIAQGRVLSPLLFNLLVNSLAAAIRRASPGVRLVPSSDFRLTDQLYADDLVALGESEADLQLALDAVTRWGRQWRFSFGVGPEKSAVMIFGPARSRPSCRVCLSGQLLPVVSSYRYLGVVLTPSLRWDAHVSHLVSRGHRLFAQCVSWARSEGLSVSFAHFLLWLHSSFPAQCLERNLSAIAHAVLRSWTWLKDVGDDISSVGPQGPRAPQFCMSLLCRTASALQRADPCPFSAVCTPFHQEDALPSQRQCSSSLNMSQELGPTGVFPFYIITQ